MKPLWMCIEGLNSFIEKQTINFEVLIQRGLFGIFGPTGCGKSTILDGMTLALYGKISRGNSDFINTNCDKTHVIYDFEVYRNGNIKKYRIERCIKRDKKDRNKYFSSLVRLIDITNKPDKILTDKKRETDDEIEKILGLNFNEFTRSVVLPQGKFSEFIKLKPSDRNKMLEKLFNLEEYGEKLTGKVKHRKKIVNNKILVVNTKIEEHGEVNKEKIELLAKELDEIETKEKQLKYNKQIYDQKYEEYKQIFELQNELKQYDNKLNTLLIKKDEIINDKYKVEKAQIASECYPYIERIKKLKKGILDNELFLKELSKQIKNKNHILEDLKVEYDKIYNKKNKDLPILIEKKQKYIQALDFKTKIESLTNNITEVKEQFKVQSRNYNSLVKQKQSLMENKEKLESNIDQIFVQKNNIEILPELREKAFIGKDIEINYNKNKELLNEIELKINTLEEKFTNNRSEYFVQLNINKDLEQNISCLNNELNLLKQNSPSNENKINAYLIGIEKCNQKIELFNTMRVRKEKLIKESNNLQQKYNELNKKYLTEENSYNQLCACCSELDKNYNDLNDKNLAYLLSEKLIEGKPCPVCGSLVHKKINKSIDIEKIKKLTIELNEFKKRIEELSSVKNKTEINRETIYNKLNIFQNDLNSIIKEMENLNIKKVIKDKDSTTKILNDIQTKIKIWNKQVEDKNSKLLELKTAETKAKVQVEGLKQKLKSIKDNLKDLNNTKVKLLREDKKLFKSYKQFKVELNVNNILKLTKQILEKDKQYKLLDKEETNLRKQLMLIDKKNNKLYEELTLRSKVLSEKKQIGLELKKQLDDCNNKLKEICGEKHPKKLIKKIETEINYINNHETELKIKHQKLADSISDIKDKQVALQEKNKNNINQKVIEQTSLNKLLTKYKLNSIDKVLTFILDEDEILKLKTKIEIYEKDYIQISSYINKLKNKLCGKSINQAEWEKLVNTRNDCTDNLEKTTKQVVRKSKEYEDQKKHWDDIQKLSKKSKILQSKMDLIIEIEKLIKGGSFIKYIGTKKLSYIAHDATNMLSYITNGSYCLELSENGSFIICDNSNGGQKRSTDSLSGGELFLTSLSLAIALSSQIQMERNSNLEFFFLDEGFGTLDNYLLDVVMNSLEKLNKHKLSIGIISHVDELKNRVPAQLILQPANNGFGTKIKEIVY